MVIYRYIIDIYIEGILGILLDFYIGRYRINERIL